MEKETNKTFEAIGLRLQQARKRLGLSQTEMAEKLGISLTFYGKIERGQQGISIQKLIELHDAIDIDLTYLLTGEILGDYSIQQIMQNIPKENHFDVEQILRHIQKISETDS